MREIDLGLRGRNARDGETLFDASPWLKLAVLTMVSALGALPAAAQNAITDFACPDGTPTVFHACALEAAQSFEPPRTPDGRPDLNGTWDVPGDTHEDLEDHPGTLDDNGYPTLVVDPADGVVPIQAWADERRRQFVRQHVHPAAACFLSGVPYLMYRPAPFQFLQTEDHFVILGERAHGYRIVTLGEQTPVGEDIKLWNGISRGHWEGNTLVIETTQQNGKSWLDQRARFYTDEATVTERLTLIGPNTLHYQATVDDPNVFTRPFTIAVAYRRSAPGTEVVEEPCYETNEALMEIYRVSGFSVYPGMSPEEAQAAARSEE